MGTSIHALPQVPVSVLPIPEAPATVLDLPQAGVTVLPAGFVPYFPPRITAEASSEGTSSAVISGAFTLTAEGSSAGSSTADLLPIQYADPAAGSDGASSVEVTTADVVEAVASSEGSSSVDTAVAIEPGASGEGTSSVDTAVRIDAIASSAGNAVADVTLVGVLFPNASSEGTSSADVVSFRPVSMNKVGETARLTTSYTQVLGWSADTATYPGSSVVSDDLIVPAASSNATIQASIEFIGKIFSARTVTMRVTVNGTPVGSPVTSASFTGTTTSVLTLTVPGLSIPAGAAIRLEALSSAGNSVAVSNNSASYVRVIQP